MVFTRVPIGKAAMANSAISDGDLRTLQRLTLCYIANEQ